MTAMPPLKVAALIDLLRSPQSGGHVKGWERLAAAAAESDLPLDLTVYFSGAPKEDILSPRVRLRQLPQIFSTARLKFLPYIPDHTDLARYHPELARQLADRDVIHTTDAFFNFTRTAERVARAHNLGLVHSFHTDQPSYARIFTAKTIESLVGQGWLGHLFCNTFKLPARKEAQMKARLDDHLRACHEALATRPIDRATAVRILGEDHVHLMRLGTNRSLFHPSQADRIAIDAAYGIPPNRLIVVFVGRLDIGKNIYTLLDAMERLVAEGLPLHLVTAGIGPAEPDIRARLPHNATVPGFIAPEDLAKLYASADVLALASEVEIRSMAMVEGLSCGLPVLVSAKSGLASLFAATDAIRTVNSGADNWAHALRAFATDTSLRQTMKHAALLYGDHHLASWHDILAKDLFPVWQQAAARAKAT